MSGDECGPVGVSEGLWGWVGACGGEWDKAGARTARRQLITHPLARRPRRARFPRSARWTLWSDGSTRIELANID